MKKKISKEKILRILKYVGIGFAVLTIVGFIGSLFGRGDGDGVRVPSYNRPSIEESDTSTEDSEDTEESTEATTDRLNDAGANTEMGWGPIIRF